MNNVQIIGRLTKDPDLRFTQSGSGVAEFTVAVTRSYAPDKTDFIKCVAWNKNAENISQYFHKGDMIALSGSIETGSYEKSDGTKVYTTDVKVDRWEFCGGKKEASTPSPTNKTDDAFNSEEVVFDEDELPF